VTQLAIPGFANSYPAKIEAAWNKTRDGIFEVGRLLIEAKEELPHGEFLLMIEAELPFGEDTAQRLMAIARDAWLTNAAHARYLPASRETLYQLTTVPIEDRERGIADGIIRPDMERRDVVRLKTPPPVREPAPVPPGRYGTIVVDPPWPMQKIERDVRPNQAGFDYPTMSEEQLAAYGVPNMAADDCHLFCWTTQKFLPMSLRLVEAWGFRYVLEMVWHKPGGFQPVGLPQFNCEFVVYARLGAPKFVDTTAFDCCFEAPRREHSRKPDEFYDVVRRVTAGPRVDVFSREKRDGFDQVGNETGKFAASA
jgi:N6-adenosine-specific RNA methylase IME4